MIISRHLIAFDLVLRYVDWFNSTEYHLPVNDVAGLNNSLHGLLWNRTMTVVASSANDTKATVTLTYTFDGSDKGYPFALHVKIVYALSDNGWKITVSASNQDTAGWPLPFCAVEPFLAFTHVSINYFTDSKYRCTIGFSLLS